MSIQFTKAVKTGSKLRMALIGPPGSGKTYSALRVATGMGGRIAVIDTEHGSARKYADEFDFDTLELGSYATEDYIAAIQAAEKAGYDILIIDSLSHAWNGKGGALEQVDKISASSKSGNSYIAWGKITPKWNGLIDQLMRSNLHLIGTMRAKQEYVIEEDEKGKKVPRKIGLGPIFREGAEFEFDIVGEMSLDHELIVAKTRCRLLDGAVIERPGTDLADTLNRWLEGEPLPQIAEIDELGKQLQGEQEWVHSGRPACALKFSDSATSALEQLTPQEADRLLAKLRQAAEEQAAATKKETAKSEPEPAETTTEK